MDDSISRRVAIDALCKMRCGCGLYSCPLNYEEDGTEECADVRWLMSLPSAQPEQSIAEWQKDFREYINMLDLPRDDYNGIMEYIGEVPSAQQNACEYWDDESNFCALNRPSAQTEQLDIRPNIVTTWRSDGLYSLICPACGYRKVVWTNFCPNCGERRG